MSLATRMLIGEEYGLLLGFEELARLLGNDQKYLENLHYAGKLGIPMKKKGSRWVAHYEDVADYVDSFKSAASSLPERDRDSYSALSAASPYDASQRPPPESASQPRRAR